MLGGIVCGNSWLGEIKPLILVMALFSNQKERYETYFKTSCHMNQFRQPIFVFYNMFTGFRVKLLKLWKKYKLFGFGVATPIMVNQNYLIPIF